MATGRIGSAFGIEVGASFLVALPAIVYLVGSRVGATVAALNALFGAGIDPGSLTDGSGDLDGLLPRTGLIRPLRLVRERTPGNVVDRVTHA